MRSFLSKVWFPVAIAAITAVHAVPSGGPVRHTYAFDATVEVNDTVKYRHDGYRKGWTKEEIARFGKLTDSIHMDSDTTLALADVPDSVAVAADTLSPEDSAALAYAAMSPAARKKYDMEKKLLAKQARTDSLKEVRDSIVAYRDSIRENTPRLMDTYVFSDSLQYQRLLKWTHERHFHAIRQEENDTSFNYHFNDYPFLRRDVNASWLGVAGSPVLYHNFFNRKSDEGVSFYEAQESWSKSAATLESYNTKTPYTEMAYYGTLFAPESMASDNIHLLTTQNFTPEMNLTLMYDKFGGSGILTNEKTTNKTAAIGANYLGRKYTMHAGYIYNMVSRNENGGVLDNHWILDTLVKSREIAVALGDASSKIKKNTVFLDQQYRIPFNFLAPKPDDQEDEDAELENNDITTAFIGHSSEFSVYRRKYEDNISTDAARDFYNGVFNYNPVHSSDSLRVMRFENRLFLRLQPWSSHGVVSKLDVGIGERLMNYYKPAVNYLQKTDNYHWNATYLYAGVEGQIKNSIHWDALGDYVFLGDEMNDMSLSANASLNVYPFRKARKSPLTVNAHFETSLDEPEYYQQHFYSNHFSWENSFSKISTTKLEGSISIPRWRVKASVGYALLANNIYYDTQGIACQNIDPMSIFSASLKKDFVIGNFLHLDHNLLFQLSSNEDVVPLPRLASNLRYYIELPIEHGIMHLQIGANAWYTTAWYAPGWNPEAGVFHNQNKNKYGDCPYIDAFVNIQWKRACIFVKLENAGMGWPMDKADYFSADHYIRTTRAVKFGMFWPFYTQPSKNLGKNLTGPGSR